MGTAWATVTYGNNLFVAASKSKTSTDGIATSTDAKTWTAVSGVSTQLYCALDYGNNTYVMTQDSTSVRWSTDGITWNLANGAGVQSTNVAFGDNTFVIVGWFGGRAAYSTDDGRSYTLSNVPEQNKFYGVTYGNGVFVATATSGTNRIMYSEDKGENWSMQAAPEDNDWEAVAFGANKFVAVARNGTNRVMWIDSL